MQIEKKIRYLDNEVKNQICKVLEKMQIKARTYDGLEFISTYRPTNGVGIFKLCKKFIEFLYERIHDLKFLYQDSYYVLLNPAAPIKPENLERILNATRFEELIKNVKQDFQYCGILYKTLWYDLPKDNVKEKYRGNFHFIDFAELKRILFRPYMDQYFNELMQVDIR